MKRIIIVVLAISLLLCSTACGSSTENLAPERASVQPSNDTSVAEEQKEADLIDDEAWDALEEIGSIETENGLLFVTITIPSDLIGEDISQETLNAQSGENYISATLNSDGSVSYKLTKKQHKAMLDEIISEIDDGLNEIVNSSEYTFTNIEHNADYSEFDVYLSTEDIGFAESFMTVVFYMYGGMYAIFSGRTNENIIVNFYAPDGTLISTANSSDMGA